MSMNHVFLGLLVGGPRHGYDLKRLHDQNFPGARPLAYGQVYATLARLERDGHVEVSETTQDGGPERTLYALTDAGRTNLQTWLDTPEPPIAYGGAELVRKALTALHLGQDAAGYLARQRQTHLARMRELVRAQKTTAEDLDGSAPGQPDITSLSADYAVAHLDADLRWLEAAAERIARTRNTTKEPR
jgi:DNA-binding PadR family transcriptional regulator